VTLAPELPGAAAAIETLRAAGVVVAAGHTEATAGGQSSGRAAQVRDGVARLVDGTLAGSTLTMDAALRNLVAYAGAPVHEAIAAATSTPATVLGLATKGRVATGADADLVVLTRELEVAATIVGGNLVYECP
jgi:N-acetylglucosamine-6-phosphate deacetylase